MKNKFKFSFHKIFGIVFAILFCFLNSDFNFLKIENTVEVSAENLTLNETEIVNLSKYDSRDYNFVTSVKDQGSSSLCWAYAAISAAETSILKSGIDSGATKDNLSLSPTSIGYGRFNRYEEPLGNAAMVVEENGYWLSSSGESIYAGILMSQWWGPISNSLSASVNAYENNLYKLKNMVRICGDDSVYNFDIRISEMKKAIAKYGAITFSYNNLREVEFYNPKRETGDDYYFHACTIIGWDDDIEASRFVPSGTVNNGGWLVKNSYSSLPYFWLSYECTSSNIYAFDFSNNEEFDYNYFYDDSIKGGLTEDLKTQYVANIYEAKNETSIQDEYLKAVNIAFACNNTTVTVSVYTNLSDNSNPESGILKATKAQTFEQSGYRTIELDDLVKIKKGEKFSIVIQLSSTSSSSPYVSTAQGNGLCYRKYNGSWSKINNNALRIKGYTILDEKQNDENESVNIQNASILDIPSLDYTGNEIEPDVTLTYNGVDLVKNVDYTIVYSNNINASKLAKISISGIGNFYGTKDVYFTINKAIKPNIYIPKVIDNSSNYKNLSSIQPPSGFVWEDSEIELRNGVNNVNIVYNKSDKDNYETITFSVVVTYHEIIKPDISDNEQNNNPSDEMNENSGGNDKNLTDNEADKNLSANEDNINKENNKMKFLPLKIALILAAFSLLIFEIKFRKSKM